MFKIRFVGFVLGGTFGPDARRSNYRQEDRGGVISFVLQSNYFVLQMNYFLLPVIRLYYKVITSHHN